MRWCALLALGASVGALSSVAARAAEVVSSAAPPTAAVAAVAPSDERDTARPLGGEPIVKRIVIEDGRARIEELRVRGQLQKITVEPKGRAPAYEVLTGDGWHATAEDPGTSRGSAGKRVWNVLRF